MEILTLLLISSALATANTSVKQFRTDYIYNQNTDRFYKFHRDHLTDFRQADLACGEEGTKLMTQPTSEDMRQVRIAIRRARLVGDKIYIGKDEQPGVPAKEQKCKLIRKSGTAWPNVNCTAPFLSTADFMCVIDAKDVGPRHSECGTFGHGYQYVQSVGSCYLISNLTNSWIEGRLSCDADGAHLAIIDTQEEYDVVKNLVKSTTDSDDWFAVGFRRDPNDASSIHTTSGDPLKDVSFMQWAAGEPSTDHHKNCGTLRINEAKMQLAFCYNDRLRFICEKEVTK